MATHNIENLLKGTQKGRKFQVGIHTATLSKIEENKQGDISITFSNPTGNYIDKILWVPKGTYPKSGESKEAAIKREEEQIIGTLAQLIVACGLKDAITITGEKPFEKIKKEFISILQENVNKTQLQIKVILDSNGKHTALPNYGFVAAFNPEIGFTLDFTEWEKQNRLPKPESTMAISGTNNTNNASIPSTNSNDLPF